MLKNEYLLLTPGPLSTTSRVREAMQLDLCTWDDDYLELVQSIREALVTLATKDTASYTAVLMQGSGTFGVESVIGSVMPKESGKLLIATNGAYGDRIAEIADVLGIETVVCRAEQQKPIDVNAVEQLLKTDRDITHTIVVHCETTTGILNPVKEVCALAKTYEKTTIVDAMSSFGGIEIDVAEWKIDFLISSANKCIQGVPGFSFIIANKENLQACKGQARSLSLDLYDQWKTMEERQGKWRYTSPTHTVRAFKQALLELEEEGGVQARFARYTQNQKTLVHGMTQNGFTPYIDEAHQSPMITSFIYPNESFDFNEFYNRLKTEGFVIYPGKVSEKETFRIGNIGDVYPHDIERLVEAVKQYING
ncbi:2-aminoethylphosphonate--pyruvate transaminase [Bacillaceae bacterium SIJ1]|uniref:2-aminoethylphosphonate--pyruvate transaminase n=1 Tax=Litoribacterium kuwaitense TaxID=1398745 RepID=UPI0013EAE656|nr:2-aminoethylphosphonate--pyruvate transaminase [Litoribacterium kuwaitense]NGP44916.1 2-aminoethylphosphonate--pyruvate transaminase [Litoribacterium kuwaitense]